MSPRRPLIALDLDGVLVDSHPSLLLPHAKAALTRLQTRGRIIIHTSRSQDPRILPALAELDLSIAAVWTAVGKPNADAYIDDRAVPHHGDWEATLHALDELLDRRRVR